jgi:magnesium-transporting ATPase (P-type)
MTPRVAPIHSGAETTGLTSDEAANRLEKFGPNAVPDTTLNPLRRALEKFWAPVPWMLEAAIVLQTVLGEYVEAAIIAGLLVFNAALGFFQEGRAQATLAALKSRLALTRDSPAIMASGRICPLPNWCRRHSEAVARRRGCGRRAPG